MNDDLSDVGLNALEAMEAEDTNSTSDAEDTGAEDTQETENETTQESTEEAGENTEEPQGDDEETSQDGEEDPQKVDNDEGEKSEPSDEEFEEMAKKRGYSKAENKQETTEADQLAELTKRPKEISEEVWAELPEENKLIYNALPYITAEGKDGTIQVKTPDQLPDNFEFANQKAQMKFQNDLQAQENRATQMANAINARRERQERMDSERAEAQTVITEIEKLQKSGDLPTPKAKAGTREFDDDPAVVLINKVLGYRARRAAEGVNLPIRESYLLYKAEHPEDFEKKEAKGDIERKAVARKVAGGAKAAGSPVNKEDNNKPQYYKVGMSTEDVLDRILDDMD